MPVRSSGSSVLRWPDRDQVLGAARRWAAGVLAAQPAVRAIGCFGSYARGDWGVGSDLDLVAIVTSSDQPFAFRGRAFDATSLPVPSEIVVYTLAEWERKIVEPGRFARALREDVLWLAGAPR